LREAAQQAIIRQEENEAIDELLEDISTAEILVWKQKMCSESVFCLSVLKILTPHFQVAS
jgi:hypothetical protein